jgi:hypothetical protein
MARRPDATEDIDQEWEAEPLPPVHSIVGALAEMQNGANELANAFEDWAHEFHVRGEAEAAVTFLHVAHVLYGFEQQARDCLAALYMRGSSFDNQTEALERLFGEGFVSGHLAELDQEKRPHDA